VGIIREVGRIREGSSIMKPDVKKMLEAGMCWWMKAIAVAISPVQGETVSATSLIIRRTPKLSQFPFQTINLATLWLQPWTHHPMPTLWLWPNRVTRTPTSSRSPKSSTISVLSSTTCKKNCTIRSITWIKSTILKMNGNKQRPGSWWKVWKKLWDSWLKTVSPSRMGWCMAWTMSKRNIKLSKVHLIVVTIFKIVMRIVKLWENKSTKLKTTKTSIKTWASVTTTWRINKTQFPIAKVTKRERRREK